ncbi:MAG: peptide deformylase [Bacteroidetes bacterium]|nr:MAG: peptide deformylase [Bacteroidota bacterium]
MVIPIYSCFHPILRKKTSAVIKIDDDIKKLVENMFETMYKADGIGLAANQVGQDKSLIVIDINASKDKHKSEPPITLINPVIEQFSDNDVEYEEGCLSIPKFYEKVMRPEIIQIKYLDLDMKEHVVEAGNLLSRVMQHEVDHLNGIIFTERLSPINRTLAKSKLRKIQKGQVIPDYPYIDSNGNPLK